MGTWNLTIQGTGCYHNSDPDIDIDQLAFDLLAQIKAQGHSIQSATLSHGGRIDLLTDQPSPLKKLKLVIDLPSFAEKPQLAPSEAAPTIVPTLCPDCGATEGHTRGCSRY